MDEMDVVYSERQRQRQNLSPDKNTEPPLVAEDFTDLSQKE